MKKLLLFTILLALPLLASAYRCNVDGIYFNLIPGENLAEVTYQNTNQYGYPQSDYSGSVTIPEEFTYEGVEYSVTTIGNRAFWGCSNLTSMTIPNSVTSIGSYAFYDCSGLSSVTIPNSVTSIGERAFSGCRSLSSFTIPNSVNSIGDAAFQGCKSLSSIKVESGNTKYDSRDNCNAIIETEINMLIAGCMNTIIPNSVTSIGGYAFEGCSSLTSVNITDLEAWCKISFDILHASNPLVYAHHLYLNGEEVKDLVIPNSMTSIGESVFSGCSGLTSVTIPNSVTSIGDYAFRDCIGLTSVIIPNSVTSIGSGAFYVCTGLTSVTIPNSVTTIGSNAFSNCTSLTSVTIPSSVTTIEIGVFWSCWGLSSVTIPNSVTSIGDRAFSNCGSLTSVTIPNSVISIGNFAFNECINLTSVTIPNSVTTIGNNAFSYCSDLPSVIIPNSVTTIGNHAFIGCDKLKFVYCYAEKVPLTSESAFRPNNVLINATLYVPAASQNDYKNSRPWSYFLTILPLPDETGIDNTVNKKAKESARFTLDGIKGSGTRKGLNIIRMNDGTVKKVVVK